MFKIDESEHKLRADIRVLGIGGGGGNAIETMWKEGIGGVKFIAVNTDAQALTASGVETKIQLGANLTKGLGAGANPEVGRRAAIESYEDIAQSLKGADMVFITAGMGGGTGTGGISVIAEAAKELGALTVGVVTYPFLFEGRKRRRNAQKGIDDLKNYVDTLIVIHNDKLLSLADDKTPLAETFQKTDDILFQAVKGIAGLISVKGLINLDFADVKTVMHNKGMALMGVGIGEGSNRVTEAVSQAISSPLLENISIKGATGVIANITGSANLSLMEVNQAISLLTDEVDEDAEIIVGAVIDHNKKDSLSLTVIATGFDDKNSYLSEEEPHKIKWNSSAFSKDIQKNSSGIVEKQNNIMGKGSDQISKKEITPIRREGQALSTNKNFPTGNFSSDERRKDENSGKISSEVDKPEGKPQPSLEADKTGEQPFSKKKEDLTSREILLSKVQEYKEQKALLQKNQAPESDRQMSIPLGEEKKPFSDNESLLFETDVELTSDDIR